MSGQTFRARRRKLGITQEEAARRCGVHPVEFARAERGVRDLRISTVARIAAGLEIPASRLLRGV